EDLARLPVVHVVVERPSGVGDLAAPVAAHGRSDQRALDARACPEGPLRVVDGPSLGAGAVTGAAPVLVARKAVEHVAAAVEQDAAERRRLHSEGRCGGAT